MLKISSLIFLVAMTVAISWSVVDAKPHIREKREIPSGELSTASAEDAELSEDSAETVLKKLMSGMLLLTVAMKADDPAIVDKLEDEFAKAVEQKYDDIDAFAERLAEVYEKVVGKKLSEPVYRI